VQQTSQEIAVIEQYKIAVQEKNEFDNLCLKINYQYFSFIVALGSSSWAVFKMSAIPPEKLLMVLLLPCALSVFLAHNWVESAFNAKKIREIKFKTIQRLEADLPCSIFSKEGKDEEETYQAKTVAGPGAFLAIGLTSMFTLFFPILFSLIQDIYKALN
jgi:hypothetical protein